MPAVLRRLLRHRSALVGLLIVLGASFVALTCHWLTPFDPVAQFREHSTAPPGTEVILRGGPDQPSPNAPPEAKDTCISGCCSRINTVGSTDADRQAARGCVPECSGGEGAAR